MKNFGVAAGGSGLMINAGDVRATITMSSERAVPGRELGVSARFEIPSGWHIYGSRCRKIMLRRRWNSIPRRSARSRSISQRPHRSSSNRSAKRCRCTRGRFAPSGGSWSNRGSNRRLQTQGHASFPGMQRSDLQAAAEDCIRDPDCDRFDGRRREVVCDYMSWYARATFSPSIPRRPESFIGAIIPFNSSR